MTVRDTCNLIQVASNLSQFAQDFGHRLHFRMWLMAQWQPDRLHRGWDALSGLIERRSTTIVRPASWPFQGCASGVQVRSLDRR